MARKRSSGEEGGGDSWMNTYADMVTLLLTFFALLLSMSTVDQAKFNAFIRSFSNLPQDVIEEIINASGSEENGSIVNQNAMDALYESLRTYVDENERGDMIYISKVNDIIYIRFSSDLFFEPDRYVLRSTSYDTLSFIGDAIKLHEEAIRTINICGHTADIREGNSGIASWMLSGERAAVVAMYFEQEKGIQPDKLIAMGYGDNYPVGDNSTEAGRRLNRRVELVIIGNDSDFNMDVYNSSDSLLNSGEYPAGGSPIDIFLQGEGNGGQAGSASESRETALRKNTGGSGPKTGGALDETAVLPPENTEASPDAR